MKKLLLLTMLAVGAMSAANAETVTASFANCVDGSTVTLPAGWEFKDQSRQTFRNENGGLHADEPSGFYSAYIISPKLSGSVTVSYYLDPSYYGSYGGYIYVYKAEPDGDGGYTVSESTANTLFTSSDRGSAKTGTFTVSESSQFAIYITDASLISVTYTPDDTVVVPPEYKIKLSTLSVPSDIKYFAANPEGNVPVQFTVNATNQGEETITADNEDITFTLSNSTIGELGPISWTGEVTSIEPGATETITLTGSFPYSLFAESTLTPSATTGAYWAQFSVAGEYTNGTASKWFDVYPYEVLYRLSKTGSTDPLKEVNFGFVNSSNNTFDLQLLNLGILELNATQIVAPLGFSVSKETPFTLPAYGNATNAERTTIIPITANTETPGIFTGNLEIAVAGMDTPATIPLISVVVGGDEYYEDFEDGSDPAGWIISSGLNYYNENNLGTGNTKALTNTTTTNEKRAITPLLHFNEGEKLAFQAYTRSTSNSSTCVKVYTSPDRVNWTQKALIKNNPADVEGEYAFPGRYTTSSYSSYYSSLGTYLLDMDEGDVYIAFDMLYAGIDNIYGGELVHVDHDLVLTGSTFPAKAVVNNEIRPSISIRNIAPDAEEADSYEVSLLIDGENVATVTDTPAIEPTATEAIEVPYTFHQPGEYIAKMEFRAGDYVLTSEEATITVTPETALAVTTVGGGTPIKAGNDNSTTPFDFYFRYSVGMVLYTQEYLAQYGITPGMTITGLSYNGYMSSSTSSQNGPAKIYILPTELTEITDSEDGYNDLYEQFTDETIYFDGNITAPEVSSTVAEMYYMSFDTPYVYNGGNIIIGSLRLVGNYNMNTFIVIDTELANRTLTRGSDTSLNLGTIKTSKGLPQTNFYVELEPATYSGTVVNAETQAPVADATITLTSDNVLYSGTSDAEGAFSIDVIQSSKDYDVIVSAPDYNEYSGVATFADGNVVTTIELTSTLGSGVGSVNADKVNVRIEGNMIFVDGVDAAVLSIFNAAGQMMTRADATAISIANLNAGVYVLNVKSANGTASVKFVKR